MRSAREEPTNFLLKTAFGRFWYEHKVHGELFTHSQVYYPFSLLLVNLDSDF